jgi:hypothetical protein
MGSVFLACGRVYNVDFDPLRYLIQKAHAARFEVHPWFCVTYRDRHFRRWFTDKFGTSVDILDKDGKAIDLGADEHAATSSEQNRIIGRLLLGQHLKHGLGDNLRSLFIRMQLVSKMLVPQQRTDVGQGDAVLVPEFLQSWVVAIPLAVDFPGKL